MKNFLRLALILPLFYSMVSYAEIYRWVDKNGITHYSDTKPTDSRKAPDDDGIEIIEYSYSRKAEKEEVADKTPEKEKEKALLSKEADSSELTEQKQQVEALTQTAKQDKCQDLRLQLAALQETGSPVFEDEDGNYRLAGKTDLAYSGKRTYLPDSDVADRLKAVKTQIGEDCPEVSDSLQQKVRADWIRSEYCDLNKLKLSELKQADAKTAASSIKMQEDVVSRYCDKLTGDEHRDDEDYYPQSLPQAPKKPYTTALSLENMLTEYIQGTAAQ